MTYIDDDWNYVDASAARGVYWVKYGALAGFIILLVSAIVGVFFSLKIVWPFALIGAVMWVVFGAAYRKSIAHHKDEGSDWREL